MEATTDKRNNVLVERASQYAISFLLSRGYAVTDGCSAKGGVIRDTMYIDGGLLSFLAGMADGTNDVDLDQAPRPYTYYISFNESFNTTQNVSDIIHTIKLPPNNLGPNYYDGTMLTSDYELLLFGGLLAITDSNTPPDYNKVLSYEKYQHFTAQRPNWVEDWNSLNLPTNMTRYITQGAGVSVPSENLGFYFSGMRAAGWGEIYRGVNYATSARTANITADTLISVDMSTMRSEKWSNVTLPSDIRGRANAELAWVPVANQGALLAIGGVINPEDQHYPTDQQLVESKTVSPGFMKQISIYDIHNQKWYTQDTTGDIPGALTQFCSVVASAKDGSSHSIYIYGGYDGQKDPTYSDDVYVLSVPSFIWTKVYSGTSQHARAKHKCSKPYPDQMIVVGGNSPDEVDTPTSCLGGSLIQIFNLNTLVWQDKYDPKVWSEYKIPGAVVKNIGGNEDGGATTTKPAAWGDDALSSLFGVKYAGSITTYYPYKTVPTGLNPSRTNIPLPSPQTKSGMPVWVAPVLGVVLGLVAISAIAACFMLHRRSKRSERGGSGGPQSGLTQNIMSWLNSSTPATKTATVTSEDPSIPPSSPLTSNEELSPPPLPNDSIAEVVGRPVYELPGPVYEMDTADTITGARPPPQMSERSYPQESDPRARSPTSRRAIHSFASSIPSTRPHHSHNVSDVSATTEPDHASPVSPGLAVTPEDGAPETNPMDSLFHSPVSPPLDGREDPLAGQGSSSSGAAPPARAHQDSPSKRRTKSSFEENFG